ncbi:hypothetical protein CTI12_AA488840 [Artemisia annua]|uniref:Uncharacterized protein n=1 Tax=Artemisia annua TaxID=35608 RepID=A0A2U1LI26_ARTAN|nr:hypothetical protein CTI12_AA488840 [Artemisia annua]
MVFAQYLHHFASMFSQTKWAYRGIRPTTSLHQCYCIIIIIIIKTVSKWAQPNLTINFIGFKVCPELNIPLKSSIVHHTCAYFSLGFLHCTFRLYPAKTRLDPAIPGHNPADPVISDQDPVRPGISSQNPLYPVISGQDPYSASNDSTYQQGYTGIGFFLFRCSAWFEYRAGIGAMVVACGMFNPHRFRKTNEIDMLKGSDNPVAIKERQVHVYILSYQVTGPKDLLEEGQKWMPAFMNAFSPSFTILKISATAVDYYVSMHTNVFISASPGNMHNAMLSSIQKLEDYQTKYGALQLFLNETMEWPEFQWAIQNAHKNRQGQVKGDTIHIYPSQYQIVCVNNISW